MFIELRFELRSLLLKCLYLLCISFSATPLAAGQVSSVWRLATKFPSKPETVILSRNDRKARTPRQTTPERFKGLKPPILESLFFTDQRKGWVVGNHGFVARTRDGGETWSSETLRPAADLNSVFFSSDMEGWIVGSEALSGERRAGIVMHTKNGGDAWIVQSRPGKFELSVLNEVVFANSEHGWAVGVVQEHGTVQGIIYVTLDGGQNWSVQYLAGQRSGSLSRVKFIDARVGWAIGEDVVLHTTDGGEHWAEQRHDKGDYLFDIISVSPVDLWMVGGNGLLLHTVDGGTTWQRSGLPPKWQREWFSRVLFIDNLRGWVVGDNGLILATTNGGKSWQLESTGKSAYLRAITVTSTGLFAAGNDGIILKRTR